MKYEIKASNGVLAIKDHTEGQSVWLTFVPNRPKDLAGKKIEIGLVFNKDLKRLGRSL